ncbi:hypothetical protein F5884DRAFT_875530 [Xylogone sp. PMI_703]|nr:hypothetical protein F5884DRAFT_875530 [Xylogone sp. PMI_703]
MRILQKLLIFVALFALDVYAQAVFYTPSGATDIRYRVSVPEGTTRSGSGDIFFQMTAPITYQWIGLGIGSRMAGARIFVVYQDGTGNVTISPRNGVGEVMPLLNSTASVTLLEGSGVTNNTMTANVRYTADLGTLNFQSTRVPWICSWKSGSPLNNPSQSAVITQHDSFNQFTFDLTAATIASDHNPFVAADGSPVTAPGSSGSSSGVSAQTIKRFQEAHGIIMASTMVIILPAGALILRIFGGVWLHASIQVISLAAIIAGFALGVRLVQDLGLVYSSRHPLFGTFIVFLFVFQPIFGLLHHQQFKKLKMRSYFGHLHIWYGRILIICGIINGGLGLKLAANSPHGIIAYSIVAGAIGLLYIAVMVGIQLRNTQAYKRVDKQETIPMMAM